VDDIPSCIEAIFIDRLISRMQGFFLSKFDPTAQDAIIRSARYVQEDNAIVNLRNDLVSRLKALEVFKEGLSSFV
jgi:hypothetical protein